MRWDVTMEKIQCYSLSVSHGMSCDENAHQNKDAASLTLCWSWVMGSKGKKIQHHSLAVDDEST